jgi:TonB family protein
LPALVALATPPTTAGQHSASQRLDAAFAQLKSRRPDSAAVLLHPVLDSTVRATPFELGAAWFLAGIVDYYTGAVPDSTVARDFRAALTQTLALRGDWLTPLDSALGAIWNRERCRAICGGAARESRTLLGPGDSALVVDEKPRILSGPLLHYPEFLREAHVTGRVLLAAIVDTAGRVDPATIKVLTTPHEGLAREARSFMVRAKFQPGRVGGRAVRTCVELPVDFKIR